MSYNEKQEDIVYSYYLLCLYSIAQGESIEELEYLFSDFEEEELYEQCDGVRRAIEFAKTNTLEGILLELNKETNNQV
jgi:hypothetical protein